MYFLSKSKQTHSKEELITLPPRRTPCPGLHAGFIVSLPQHLLPPFLARSVGLRLIDSRLLFCSYNSRPLPRPKVVPPLSTWWSQSEGADQPRLHFLSLVSSSSCHADQRATLAWLSRSDSSSLGRLSRTDSIPLSLDLEAAVHDLFLSHSTSSFNDLAEDAEVHSLTLKT